MEHRVTLSRLQIEGIIDTAKADLFDGFSRLWHEVLGHSLADHPGQVEPSEWKLPKAQSLEIMRRFQEIENMPRGTVAFGILGLFLQKGPSSFNEGS